MPLFETDCWVCPRCNRRFPRKRGAVVAAAVCLWCPLQQTRCYATTVLDWPNVAGSQLDAPQLAAMVARMPPLPPGPPPVVNPLPKLSSAETIVYKGVAQANGRGRVLFKVTNNLAQGMISVYADAHTAQSDLEASVLRMQFHNSLLTANPPQASTLIKSPIGGDTAWAVLRKSELDGSCAKAAWNEFPAEVKIGISLGEPRFGLIHFLSGHAGTINTFLGSEVGKATVFRFDHDDPAAASARAALNTNALQAMLTVSFAAPSLHSVLHAGGNKFILIATDHRKMVIDRQGGPVHTLTTMYGANETPSESSTVVWSRA
jgi:hypothetical protein